MIELNKTYTSAELAKECGLSYSCFRTNRIREENHLHRFYEFDITYKGKSILYTFTEQFNDYIPYREYNSSKRNKIIRDRIDAVIHHDARQTGSNIARLIYVEDQIQALNLELSTLTNYTRENLKDLVKEGYYIKTEYQWCYLDQEQNKYVEMTKSQIEELRSYFKSEELNDKEEELFARSQEHEISQEETEKALGRLRLSGFIKGIEIFSGKYGYRPMKVPVYVRSINFKK